MFSFPRNKEQKSLFSAFQSLPNQMAWDFLLGSQEVEPLPNSFTSHSPDIWVQRLEGKKTHRPLLAWEWSGAQMGSSDAPLSACWEAKIIWALIFLRGLIVQDNPRAHISPHTLAAHLKLLFIPTFSSRREEQSLELAQLPASLQERAPCVLFYPMYSDLSQTRKSEDPGEQGPRTGGHCVHM